MKLVLITHFSTGEVREKLQLDYKRRLYFIVNRLLGRKLPNHDVKYDDVTPWVPDTISYLEKRSDVDLYVISAHTGMKKRVQGFKIRNVNYYFFNTDFSLFLQRVLGDNMWSFLEPNRRVVKRIVNRIKPDVINLIGSDGAYFSNTILGIKGYPVFVSLQTVYSNPDRKKYGQVWSKNWNTEQKVFAKERYYGCMGKLHYDLLISYQPNAIGFKFAFPGRPMPFVPEATKKYDFVTFAQACSDKKGTFDALRALGIVKKKFPNVTLNVCGMRPDNTEQIMRDIIEKEGLQENVIFTDFFEKQYDLFCHLKKSKYAVLPIKLDIISGTVHQAMALGLPVITNITTGTPTLNKEKQCVLLCEINNIDDLAQNMIKLYEDESLANGLKDNSLEHIRINRNPEKKVNMLMEDLYAVYNHYHNNEPIPEHLLFNNDFNLNKNIK